MTLRQRVLKYAVTALVGCLLLALIVWMVRSMGRREGYHTVTLDDPAARKMAEQADREKARREARWLAMRYPEVATVPWSRDAAKLEPTHVALAGQPFADRNASRPLPVYVYVARFRPFGKRHSLENPDPVKLQMAEVPWNEPRRQRRHVVLEPARLPNLPRMRDLRMPDEATIAVAGVPWGVTPALSGEAPLPSATVPWTPGRQAGDVEAVVAAAQIPSIRAKRDPRRPEPAGISTAQLPWGRDASRPEAAHVEEARISSRLRMLTPAKP